KRTGRRSHPRPRRHRSWRCPDPGSGRCSPTAGVALVFAVGFVVVGCGNLVSDSARIASWPVHRSFWVVVQSGLLWVRAQSRKGRGGGGGARGSCRSVAAERGG